MVKDIDIMKKVREVKGIRDCYVHPISSFFNGRFTRNKKDRIKMELGFDAKELVKDECKGIPMSISDYKLVPLILFVEFERKPEEEKHQEG